MSNLSSPRYFCSRFSALLALMFLLVSTLTLAQSTVGTGSVQGTVTDQSGAVVANARVTITNKATAGAIHLTASSAGSYSSGPIQPGDYVVRAEAKGFKTEEDPLPCRLATRRR